MTFPLRHRTWMLVAVAVTAVIGLSSCADTFTGLEGLEAEEATEAVAPHNDAYRAEHTIGTTHQGGRVVPTPGVERPWLETGQAASQQRLGDALSHPLSDSTETPVPPPLPSSRRLMTRF